MKRLWMVGLAATLAAPALRAQQPETTDTAEAGRLRAQIEQRFSARVKDELGLSDDQAGKLRTTQERFGAQRRSLAQQQAERRHALSDQMRPGVSANADSVNKLMAGLRSGREQMMKIDQDEDREMQGYLTPVQRAQFLQLRERFMERVGEMRMQRERGQMGGGRMGPRPLRGGGGRRRGI
ncbi:MAG TPA: Spy/CpxP family protein refolding chaperone [Gemmatimonadales bacterium]|jgi:hypothetical protein|nr:Spy/CpxP family protein refolding chaperone [Gemmatimonadales bacterium]